MGRRKVVAALKATMTAMTTVTATETTVTTVTAVTAKTLGTVTVMKTTTTNADTAATETTVTAATSFFPDFVEFFFWSSATKTTITSSHWRREIHTFNLQVLFSSDHTRMQEAHVGEQVGYVWQGGAMITPDLQLSLPDIGRTRWKTHYRSCGSQHGTEHTEHTEH